MINTKYFVKPSDPILVKIAEEIAVDQTNSPATKKIIAATNNMVTVILKSHFSTTLSVLSIAKPPSRHYLRDILFVANYIISIL